jgi:hypothetical protein
MQVGDSTATKIGTGIGNTVDGLSFDDQGNLWGADNFGNIFNIDTSTGLGTLVATISNSEVKNSGIHSLAISQLDPGTYVTLGEGVDSYTKYYQYSDAAQGDVLVSSETGFAPGVEDVNVSITGRTITITQNDAGANPVDSIAIRVDDSATITVDGFEQTDVFSRNGEPSIVNVTDAEGGTIQTGEAGDEVNIDAAAADTDTAVTSGEVFNISTDGGDDIINLGDLIDSTYNIEAGESLDPSGNLSQATDDFDTVAIDGDLDLGSGIVNLSNVEAIDITGTGDNSLTLSVADVLGASDDTNILIVQGDTGDSVASGDSWVAAGTKDEGGVTYNIYTQSDGVSLATLLVEQSVDTTDLS